MSEEVKDAISRRVDRVATTWEPRLREQARQQFEIDRDKLLAVLDEQKALKQTIDWQTVEKKWQTVMQEAGDRWREAFIPVIRGLVVDQAERYNVEFGYSFDVRNLYSEEWLLDYTMPFAEAVKDTTGDALNELLTQAQAEGWSVPQTQKHLRQMFEQYIKGGGTPEQFAWFKDRMPAYRTEMIARTESVRASSRGSQKLYEEWGVEFKQWHTAVDDRRCAFCAEMHGKVIPIKNAFFPKGGRMNVEVGEGDERRTVSIDFNYERVDGPCLHPGCRCVLLPVITIS